MTIFEKAAELCEVDPLDLFGHCRFPEVVEARNACFYVLNRQKRDPWSYKRIARYLGRDHSAVRYGVLKAEQRAKHDPHYRELIKQLGEVIHG